MPWLFTEVYTSVAHTTLNHMLNDSKLFTTYLYQTEI